MKSPEIKYMHKLKVSSTYQISKLDFTPVRIDWTQ
jgi:hypothetical protein